MSPYFNFNLRKLSDLYYASNLNKSYAWDYFYAILDWFLELI